MMSELMDGQVSMLDLVGSCLKTSQGPLTQTTEKTSVRSSKRSVISETKPLMYLDLRDAKSGLLQGASWEMVTQLPGKPSTLLYGESPSAVRECTLLSILDLNAPQKYNLSAKASLGVLHRAEKRKRELPPMLKEALLETIELG